MAGTNMTFGIQHVLSVVDKMSAPAKRATASLEKTATVANKMGSAIKRAFAVAGVMVGVNMLKSSIGEVIRLSVDLDKTLMNVGSKLGFSKGSEEYERLSKKASELGENTIFSTSEVARAFDFLAMAGFNTVDALEGNIDALTQIAQASGLGLDRATDIASDMIGIFKKSGVDMQRVGDVLAMGANNANTTFEMMFESMKKVGPVADTLNMSIEETTGAILVLANAGIKSSEAGTKMKTILANLSNPVGQTAKALEKFGIEVKDSAGNALAFTDIFSQLEDVYNSLGTGDQAQFLQQIAGKEAMDGLAVLLNSGSSELGRFTEMLEGSQGAAANMAEIMAQSTDAKLKSVSSKWEALKIAMGKKMDSGLNDMLQAIIDSLPGLMVGMQALGSVFGFLFKILGGVIKFFGNLLQDINAMPTPLKVISGAIIGVIAGIMAVKKAILIFNKVMAITKIMMMTNPFGLIVIGIVAVIAIIYVVIRYWDKFKEFFIKVIHKVKDAFLSVFNKLPGPVQKLIKLMLWFPRLIINLVKTVIKHWDKIKGFFVAIGSFIKKFFLAWVEFAKFVVKAWIAIFKAIWGFIKKFVIDPIIKLVVGMVKLWIAYVKMVVKVWKKIFSTLWGWIKNYVIDPLVKGFKWLWDGIVKGVTWMWNGLKKVFSIVWNWIKTYVIDPLAMGFSWLWNHVKNAWNVVWEALKAIFGAIWNWIDEHVIQPVAKLFGFLWDGVKRGFDVAWEGLKTAFSGIVTFFKDHIIGPIVGAFTKMWDGIKKIFKKDKDIMSTEIAGLDGSTQPTTSALDMATSTQEQLNALMASLTPSTPTAPATPTVPTLTPSSAPSSPADDPLIDAVDLMPEEYHDLAVRHSVAAAEMGMIKVGGRIDVAITGAGQVTNVESDNPDVPISTSMNRGGAGDC